MANKQKFLTENLEQRFIEIENLITEFKVEDLTKVRKIREDMFQKYHKIKNSIENQEKIIKEIIAQRDFNQCY